MKTGFIFRVAAGFLLVGLTSLWAGPTDDYYTTQNISDGSEPQVKHYIVTPDGKTEIDNHAISTVTNETRTIIPPKPVRSSWCTQAKPSTNSCILETCPTSNPVSTYTKSWFVDYTVTQPFSFWGFTTAGGTSGTVNNIVDGSFRSFLRTSGWYLDAKPVTSGTQGDPFKTAWTVKGPCGLESPQISYTYLKNNGFSRSVNVCGATATATLSITPVWYSTIYNYKVTLARPAWVTVTSSMPSFNQVAALPLCNPPAPVETQVQVTSTQDGITNNSVTLEAGKLKYKKAPTLAAESNNKIWSRFKYKNPYTNGNWWAYTATGNERVGVSSPVGCADPKSCPTNPLRESIYITPEGYIDAYNINPTKAYDSSRYSNQDSDISIIRSFLSPSTSSKPGLCSGSDHACLMGKYLNIRPDLNNHAFTIRYGRGVDASTGVGPSASDADVHFTKRLQVKQNLVCPTNLLDSVGENTWLIKRFDGTQYVNQNTSNWDDTYTGQDAQLHENMNSAVDRGVFDSIAVSYDRDYLAVDEQQLSWRVCEKTVCPKYFSPYDASILNKGDVCKMEVKKPEIKGKIPKRLYVVYPDTGAKSTYKVPNLMEYFQGGTAEDFEYEVTEVSNSNYLNVTVEEGKTLNIEILANNALAAALAGGQVTERFKFMIKQDMTDTVDGSVNYDFNNRKLGIEFPIDIIILNPLYTPNTKELYRCQPLAEE